MVKFRSNKRNDDSKYDYPIKTSTTEYIPRELVVEKIPSIEIREPEKMMIHGAMYDDASKGLIDLYKTKRIGDIRGISIVTFNAIPVNHEDTINNWTYIDNDGNLVEKNFVYPTLNIKNNTLYIVNDNLDDIDGHEAIGYLTRQDEIGDHVYINYYGKNDLGLRGGYGGWVPKEDILNQIVAIDFLLENRFIDLNTKILPEWSQSNIGGETNVPVTPIRAKLYLERHYAKGKKSGEHVFDEY